jgi:hypothetical protein
MLKKNSKFLMPAGSALVAFGLLACGQVGSKDAIQSVSTLSSSSSEFDPRIGEGYNRFTDSYLGASCISFPNEIGAAVEFIPPKVGELVIQQDASFEDLSKALSGGGELSLNLDSFKGSGSLQFANEMQSDAYSSTVAIYYSVEQGEVALKQQGDLLTLNALGEKAKKMASDAERSKACGTGFVARKKLAANFVAVLKFEFANKGQRDSFKGNLNIDLESFSGKADVQRMVTSASSDAKITLKVRQIGGDATQLASLAVKDIAQCSTKKRDKCDTAINTLFDYLKGFPQQFADAQGKALPERFMTVANDYRSYDSVDAGWASTPISPEKLTSLDLYRRNFGEKMNDELSNYNRASSLVESGISLTPNELQEIRSIQDIIRNRVSTFAKAAQTCYTDRWESCEEKYEEAASDIKKPEYEYDVTKLVIIPADMLGWCAKLNQWGKIRAQPELGDAVANTILNFNEVYTLAKIFDVLQPEGMILDTNPASGEAKKHIVGKVECSSVVMATRSDAADNISFSQRRLDNIDPLASLEYTRTLNLSQNFITDALPLSKMRFLETLDLSKNKVSSIDGMAATYLSDLNLSDNSLAAPVKGNGTESGHKVLRHLSGLSTLEKLNLSNNRFLVSLRSLKDLPALANLNLSNTGVTTEELDSFLKRIDAEFPSLITVTVTSSNKLICDDLTSVNSRYVVCQ